LIDLAFHPDGLFDSRINRRQIVGEFDDEHDSDEPRLSWAAVGDNSFIADARASLDDVRSVIARSSSHRRSLARSRTLGGYLVTHVGRLPLRGEVLSGPGNFEIEVLDADPRTGFSVVFCARGRPLKYAPPFSRAPARACGREAAAR